MAASTQWRVRCLSNALGTMSDYYLGLAEIEMASSNAGPDLCTGGTPGASTGSNPERAFDGVTDNAGNEWKGYGWVDHWIGYTFPSPVEITEFRLWPCASTIYSSPSLMAFEYNDGSDWVISWIGFSGTWTANTAKTFRKPSLGQAPQRWWALNVVDNFGGSGLGARTGGEVINLLMRETPGGSNLATTPANGGASAWNAATGGETYDGGNLFDVETWWLGADLDFWYFTHRPTESILYYDFGSGNEKQIVEMLFTRFEDAGVQYAPRTVRALKSADGTNWVIHSEHSLTDADYVTIADLGNVKGATIATLSEFDTSAEEVAGIEDAATAFVIAVGAGMARIYADRVMETTISTGTGDITVAGAVAGFQNFASVCQEGDTFDYAIFAVDAFGRPNGSWETGRGTWAGDNTIERTTVHESSNSDSLVNFGAGTKQIILSHNAKSASSYRFGSFFTTEPNADEVLMMHVVVDEFFLPIDFAGAQFSLGTAPSDEIEFSVQVNGVEIGTITIDETSAVTFAAAAETEVELGDLITVVAPADSLGIENCAFTFLGGRN